MRGLNFAISFLKTTTAKLILSAAIIFILGIGNFLFPVIRFSNEIANEIALILILSMPLTIIVISAWLPNPWVQIALFFCIIPIVGCCLIVQLFVGMSVYGKIKSGDSPVRKYQSITVNGSQIYWYDPALLSTGSDGVVVRQEKSIFLGVSLVRELYREMPWKKHFNTFESNGADSIRIIMVNRDETDLIIPVRRFVWF